MPNPFKDATRMQYAVDKAGTAVEIGVYDLAGRLVQQLATGTQSAGIHEVSWDGGDSAGNKVRAGVYFVRGTVGGERIGARVMYLK